MEITQVEIGTLIHLVPMMFFTVLAFWKPNPALFMMAGATAFFNGIYWYDEYITNLGLSIGLILIAYCFLCFAWAFRLIFWREPK